MEAEELMVDKLSTLDKTDSLEIWQEKMLRQWYTVPIRNEWFLNMLTAFVLVMIK